MTNTHDIQTQFLEECQKADTYPRNSLRTQKFEHTLQRLNERLLGGEIFHESRRSISILDRVENDDVYQPLLWIKSDSMDELGRCMNGQTKDPHERFVFLQTASSRGPLCCSREHLTHIATYHQIMPSALDLLFELRLRDKALSTTLFRHEDFLSKSNLKFALPNQGRSGVLIQHAFNIVAFEYEKNPNEYDWPLRHVTAYHSFDIKTGRSFWMVVKGDKVMRKRVTAAATAFQERNPERSKTVEGSFVAALGIHLLLLEWSTEFLAQYIDSLEIRPQRAAANVKHIPVAQLVNDIPIHQSVPRRPTLEGGKQSRRSTGISAASPRSQLGTFGRAFSNLSRIASGFNTRTDLQTSQLSELESHANGNGHLVEPVRVKNVKIEDIFSYDELQTLHQVADELGKAGMVIDQNKRVLAELRENYAAITTSEEFREYVDIASCQAEISGFVQQVRSLEGDLENHQSRTKTLLRSLEKDVEFFHGILQYQSMQTGEFFAKSAQVSAVTMEELTHKMHEIALKTEQETVSMHIITGLTLVFLPGTFVATFFSSDVVDFNKNRGTGSIGDWVTNKSALKLFLAMCLPLMFLTLSIWSVAYIITRRNHRLDLHPEVEDLNLEKGPLASGGLNTQLV